MREIIVPDDHTILAYAAGLFDGEGNIAIPVPIASHNGKRYHRLYVTLCNTDPRCLLWLREHFGGRINNQRVQEGHKDRWRWAVSDRVAEIFLRGIRPYMIIKAEQADIALAFRALRCPTAKVTGGTRGQMLHPVEEVFEARDDLRQQLMKLTKRGSNPCPTSPLTA